MKVKYLGTLFAASVLSLGLITSCATTPEGGQTETGGEATETAPDAGAAPCAGATDPAAPPADAGQ
ncbi:MAG: hypothetical protein ACRC1Z_01850 [Waterburya sp.]